VGGRPFLHGGATFIQVSQIREDCHRTLLLRRFADPVARGDWAFFWKRGLPSVLVIVLLLVLHCSRFVLLTHTITHTLTITVTGPWIRCCPL
jgi:hypothetical protein